MCHANQSRLINLRIAMKTLELHTPAVIESIISYLIHCIRDFNQKHNTKQSVAWLFVHGFDEGSSFELGILPACDDIDTLMKENEIWDFNYDGDMSVGSYELAGVYDWHRQWFDVFFKDENADPQRHDIPILSYKDIRLTPKARAECELVGVALSQREQEEPENTFNRLVYQDILKEALKRYPDEIQGFILENHDSCLKTVWLGHG